MPGIQNANEFTTLPCSEFHHLLSAEEGIHNGIHASADNIPRKTNHQNSKNTEDAKARTKKKKILLVERDKIMAQTMTSALQRFGYEVTCFGNSFEALGLYKSTPDQFDLVITDHKMPDLEGDKLAEEVIRIRPDIPVILYTGYSSIGEAQAKAIGIRGFLNKPFSLGELGELVRHVLHES